MCKYPILSKKARTALTDAVACCTFSQGWADIKAVFRHFVLIDCVSDRRALHRQWPMSLKSALRFTICVSTLIPTHHIVLNVHEMVKSDEEVIDLKLNPGECISSKHLFTFYPSTGVQHLFIQSEYARPPAAVGSSNFTAVLCNNSHVSWC